jgi:hypothetical protein
MWLTKKHYHALTLVLYHMTNYTCLISKEAFQQASEANIDHII